MNNFLIKFKQQIVLLVCCFSFLQLKAQPSYLSEQAEISVLTCGVGNEMYTLFGHTALRVKDFNQNLDVVYNWGMFDFKTPNFYSKFVKGDLLYFLDVSDFNSFLNNYTYDNREVVEQQLNLTYAQKMAVWNEINRQLKSNDRYYTYGFIKNNCTTKVVDVINKTVSEPLQTNFPTNNYSYRYILNEGLTNHYFEKLGINLLFGYSTNQQNKLIFLPIKLKDALTFNKSLIKSEKKLNYVQPLKNAISLNSVYTLWVIVLFLAIFVLKNIAQRIYFLIIAIFSLFLVAVSLFTHHEELFFNMWILFYNPLFFIGIVLKNKKIFFAALFLTAIGLCFMGLELIQVALPLIVLHLGYALALFLTYSSKMQRKENRNV